MSEQEPRLLAPGVVQCKKLVSDLVGSPVPSDCAPVTGESQERMVTKSIMPGESSLPGLDTVTGDT